MKKKGLIISTIVMVVVLIASLTTATYAWFTTSATATISEMSIQTTVGKGLQIATYDGANLYNGQVVKIGTATDGYKWANGTALSATAGQATGWGSDVTFTKAQTESNLIDEMYGASGDGNTMYAQDNPATAISASNVKLALPNINYFTADIALYATSAGTIFIKQLKITPSGASGKENMAGALRIALFATSPTVTAQTSVSTSLDSSDKAANVATPHFCIDPYMQGLFNGSTMNATGGASQVYVNSSSYGKSAATLATTWADHWVSSIGTITTGVVDEIDLNFTTLDEATTTATGHNALYSLGAVTVNQIVYMKLVIWFEGEDEACCQNLAGGGANITINFGLQETVTP